MGVQDREWYWEAVKEREARERGERQPKKPKTRIPVDLLDNANPPRLIGENWHWSLKLLVWLCIAVVMLLIGRLVR